ncbi:lipoprotein signal peptidase [Waterburya agarophytonicola K14]|uniref:Lipoprotein signal peptidase n=1 Tax=Waterburya agarophytonicola KI4 TaxID=2874699 RepID=A0A964FI66_9CYAN|nr:lipoprotein signal peptidase [Waterburya agarophytonicola KI4]
MKRKRIFWLVTIIGIIFDQLTKYSIVREFATVNNTFPLWEGVFHLTYVINTGAAFSVFSGQVEILRWVSLIVSLLLIIFVWYSPRMILLEQLGYGFVLAGAVGNGIDRFLFGYVVDFLDFRLINFPVFNIADVSINVGVVLLLLATFSKS